MMPGSAAFAATAVVRAVDDGWHDQAVRRRSGGTPRLDRYVGMRTFPHKPRRARGRATAWVAAAVLTAAAVAGAGLAVAAKTDRAEALQAQLASARTELDAATQTSADTVALETRIAALKDRLAELREAKIRTVVEEKTVTETVTEWVPSGDEVSVEITGFEGRIELQDVQISHAYGFSDLIGIAVNTSGEAISYAQLGCSFVDEDGSVVANAIDNKQNWLPDQTWGFSCSAQVRATGGILRVDEAV